jgi:hypothetical protein
MSFWDLWCRFAAEVVAGGRDGYVVGVVGGGLIMWWRQGVGAGLMKDMVKWGFLSLLLLAKDIDSIL